MFLPNWRKYSVKLLGATGKYFFSENNLVLSLKVKNTNERYSF
jgi:hypothetical protein